MLYTSQTWTHVLLFFNIRLLEVDMMVAAAIVQKNNGKVSERERESAGLKMNTYEEDMDEHTHAHSNKYL